MRIGFGFDVHRFVAGRPLILGGIEVPFELGLAGHSDADVLCHAIIDALFGAAALGDIGEHFPDTDARYENISSLELLAGAAGSLRDSGFTIVNIDSTLALEEPRLAGFRQPMRLKISEALGIGPAGVSVKATTTEGLGFTGRREGVAAYAVVSVEYKRES
jgi:2-C-methyl-D-erythritol 2,4-cyclodiphosphate synthase